MSEVAKMQVSVERLSQVQTKVAVEIPWEEVKGRLDEAYRELSGGVELKGFRRGKVPRKMLESLFGKHVHKEVAQRLVQESIPKAIADHHIPAVGEPEIEEGGISDGAAFAYSAVMQVVPELDVKDYQGVEIRQRPARATEEQIEAVLARKQEEHTQYAPVEDRPLRQGDMVGVDVLGKVGGEPIALEKHRFTLGESAAEKIPGLSEQLVGTSVGDEDVELNFEVAAPGSPTEAPLAARLLVTITEAAEKIVPALDDEFAKDTGEAETLEGLRELIAQQLVEADTQRAQEEAKQRLLMAVLAKNEVPEVPALVEKELTAMVRLQAMLARIQYGDQQVHEEALKEHLRDEATRRAKCSLLLEAVAKKEQIEAADAEVDQRVAEIAQAQGKNPAKVRSDYEKEGRLSALRRVIREEKALALIWSKAQVVIAEEAPAQEAAETASEAAAEAAVAAPSGEAVNAAETTEAADQQNGSSR